MVWNARCANVVLTQGIIITIRPAQQYAPNMDCNSTVVTARRLRVFR